MRLRVLIVALLAPAAGALAQTPIPGPLDGPLPRYEGAPAPYHGCASLDAIASAAKPSRAAMTASRGSGTAGIAGIAS